MCIRDRYLMTHPGVGGGIDLLGFSKLFSFPVSYLLPFGYSKSQNYSSKLFQAGALYSKILYKSLQVKEAIRVKSVSYTHLRAHETVLDLVCRLLLEKK